MTIKPWVLWTVRALLVLMAAALLSVLVGCASAPKPDCEALAESAAEKTTVLEACAKNMSCRFTPADVYSMLATAKAADACKP